MRDAKRRRKGFTLIEVLIALGLFALIGVAGFTLLNSVLRTQDATDTRLGRMAEIQRAMLVVSSDLDQITGQLGGGSTSLSLQKADITGTIVNVRYDLNGDAMTRTVAGPGGERVQTLLTQVSSVRWTFHRRRGDWLDSWPQPQQPTQQPLVGPDGLPAPTGPAPDEGVTAVALDLTLTGVDGQPTATLRRVASIPLMDPAPPVAP
ncbi:prepilin-type N-terminal cleavage/methylation domain-containing protein [Brevundimonas staleyi]|uniref:Prepilin-type N-terminal cleavage/methylation domain-containing protein n=1 Tax=Brevundimonas staleyi TaxID=74326 RepID=A0ABW0FZI1_9CAUL